MGLGLDEFSNETDCANKRECEDIVRSTTASRTGRGAKRGNVRGPRREPVFFAIFERISSFVSPGVAAKVIVAESRQYSDDDRVDRDRSGPEEWKLCEATLYICQKWHEYGLYMKCMIIQYIHVLLRHLGTKRQKG
ncbi:uncharacterized protein LOC112590034 [Harpegnathos saltator]|uniref:uncharacterized protein LOC112590034 n=1 Tax=Harpegnathos saltator TaxID=610380 RepID=UPI000DBEE176|nr:uncharacterized protein LOC112590034 [Harpegnathos saltator]